MIAALECLELDLSKWKQIYLDPSVTALSLFSFFSFKVCPLCPSPSLHPSSWKSFPQWSEHSRLRSATDYKHYNGCYWRVYSLESRSIISPLSSERGSAVSKTDHMLTLEPRIIFGNKWQKAKTLRSLCWHFFNLRFLAWMFWGGRVVAPPNARSSTYNSHNRTARVKKEKNVSYLSYKRNRVKKPALTLSPLYVRIWRISRWRVAHLHSLAPVDINHLMWGRGIWDKEELGCLKITFVARCDECFQSVFCRRVTQQSKRLLNSC